MVRAHLRTSQAILRTACAAALGLWTALLCAGCDSSLPLRSISVNATTAVVAKGSTGQMIAVGSLTDGTFTDLTYQVQWTSSSTGVAAFSDDGGPPGLVYGVAPGVTKISARFNGIVGSTQLQVR